MAPASFDSCAKPVDVEIEVELEPALFGIEDTGAGVDLVLVMADHTRDHWGASRVAGQRTNADAWGKTPVVSVVNR